MTLLYKADVHLKYIIVTIFCSLLNKAKACKKCKQDKVVENGKKKKPFLPPNAEHSTHSLVKLYTLFGYNPVTQLYI